MDGTPASFAAALFGAELAAQGGEIHLLCVTDRANPPQGGPSERSLEEACQSVLATGQAAISGRARVASRTVAQGRALAAILQQEEAVGADLVCLGSGRTRLRPGQVSAAVARESAVSVVLLREGATDAPRLSRIAVGLRDGPTAMEAARRALRIAAGTGASVHVYAVLRTGRKEEEAAIRKRLTALEHEAEELGVPPPRAEFLHGDPAAELLLAVDALRADVLLVGAGQRRPLRPLGRVVTRLTSSCPCPLLICRP